MTIGDGLMSNVISFPRFECAAYIDTFGDISVLSLDADIELFCQDGSWWIDAGEHRISFNSREAMAEWLWMAVRFVDSEGRWEKTEYLGRDYV